MKLIRHFSQWTARFRNSGLAHAHSNEEPPLRSALFSADQMEQHGKALASSHKLATGRVPDQLLPRLSANETVLVNVCNLLTAAVASKQRITPAGEWLLDNFYLIEEQIRTAQRHLPKGYSQGLPRLAYGPSAGRPRVYDIALEIISHGDGRVDTEGLCRFVAAYQSVTPLMLGELWAIPIMLRLAVIENLRRVGMRIAVGWDEKILAGTWADQMMETAEKDPKSLILVIADMARSNPPLVSAFVAEIVRRLQGLGPALALPLTWISHRLSESGLTIEQLVQVESQRQAADQVSISNSIGSLRVLGAMNWREFVETLSIVEQTLREDPSGVYGRMDFATRDHYRHATERIAKKSLLTEGDIARKAVELACAATAGESISGIGDRTKHVGFYLIDKGLPVLEHLVAVRISRRESFKRMMSRHPQLPYLGAIMLLTVFLSAGLLTQVHPAGLPDWALILLGILLLIVTSQLAAALVNWWSTLLVSPHALPKMDFSEGIPPQERTLVIVPTMLTSASGIEDLVEALEVRFLANRDSRLHFGLLTDLCDAQQESLPDDEPLVRLAQTRIDELNKKYASAGELSSDDIFFLFHRSRRWNPRDRIWMGYERKRGKLADLNALLRGDAQDRFALVVGDITFLSNVKYVITLDTDTDLPRDTARQFIGAMAHPLNRPYYDEAKRRVVEGYGILQPRVAISLPGTNRSNYARLFGGETGIDPYTRAVSDVYQDVFGEGSFIGKGIYEVDAFEHALRGRFPENRILSHDLLEGCYARAGLLSDVQLFEDFPARYSADVSRRHRWIRGDWQLAGWLLRHVPDMPRKEGILDRRNPLSGLSQWKLIDNLRRSLVPAAMTLLLLSGWTFLSPAWFWTLSVVGILLAPSLCTTILDLLRKPEDLLLWQHIDAVAHSISRRCLQLAFELACLPYEAFFSLDAIARSIWRMGISHRRMLEWTPSSAAEHSWLNLSGNDLFASIRSMWVAPLIAVVEAMYLSVVNPGALAAAAPILILWFFSPAIAWWISRPLVRRKASLSFEQLRFLRVLSRRTWAFFDQFVGPEDHWLPPDNFQQYRIATVAHRTSPTNMGLALLANLTAYDFGYIPIGTLVERTENTLQTMEGLARFRGHFYNWYDTQTLQPLPPLYVSTVDSGNLAGHLLTLRAGLLALADNKILGEQWIQGLSDTLRIVAETTDGTGEEQAAIQNELDSISTVTPITLAAVHLSLARLTNFADNLIAQLDNGIPAHEDPVMDDEENGPDTGWIEALVHQCHELLNDLTFFAPWLLLPAAPAGCEAFVGMSSIPTLRELLQWVVKTGVDIESQLEIETVAENRNWLIELQKSIAIGNTHAKDKISAIERLVRQSGALANLDYDFLYNKTRHLLSIGYNIGERRVDPGYYDLLASEARLCNFVAIAQGKLPQESWFALGRLLTGTRGEPVLLSWSGSMFEYLMPLLVMPTYDNTLLDDTCKGAVARQIEYGSQRNVPWGISESGYNTVDMYLNYQYHAFGVPGLGLKRGLAEDLVIAPYASVLALMVAPEAACLNLQHLAADGVVGKYGFFEAIDYTPVRQRRGQTHTVVRSFMAHHQGMSLLSLAYLILDRPMQKRFESDPQFQSVMLLLQERIPKATNLFSHTAQLYEVNSAATTEMPIRVFHSPDTPIPEVQLLSNGRYHVMVTNAGGGYSRWRDLAVTRWREDSTCDNWGSFCYIREVASGAFWSTAHQPTLKRPERYEAIFSEGRAEFRRRDSIIAGDGDFDTHTEIVVSPEDDIELRRVHITNRSRLRREIEVTSYAEVVLATPAADALHPAFSNLFVQTEILKERRAILCTRRPHSAEQQAPWMLHLMVAHGTDIGEVSYETDRMRFIGRGRSVAAPLALSNTVTLSNSEGSVLDPVVAIRYRIVLEPEQTVTVDMVTGICDNRDTAMNLIEKYQDSHLADRVFDLAWTHNQVILRQLNASEADAQLYARLASSVIYANASLRADAAVLIKNRRGQSGLWGYAISGDLPIVLLQIGDAANIELVRQLVQAHAYWRMKGLAVDLVIWNEDHAGYRQRLQEQIMGLIASGIEASVIDRPGGIFVRPADQISGEDRILFQSVARAVITDTRGTFAEQLDHRALVEPRMPRLVPSRTHRPETDHDVDLPERDLILNNNGLGGFTPDGREYVITLAPGQVTPAPWSNVLANPHFGTVISENGVGYTWNENAHEFRLTPWHNDPVGDSSGEALYLRDEETGHFWSPSPLPVNAATPYVIRHGFGYSVFETKSCGIQSELWVYVDIEAAVKFSVLKIRNESGRSRKLSTTGYVEWVLGDLHAKSAMNVTTEIDFHTGTLYARNPYSSEFAERVAFFDVDNATRTQTGDRTEFLGRNGTLRNPAAMRRSHLSGKVGAGLDPCGAIQVNVDLADGEEQEVVFLLGAGSNGEEASQLVQRFRSAVAARASLKAVRQYWDHTLNTVQIETPDPSVNVLANGWLMYQTLACRVWARSGYYQSGGAFGFRDQLQDVMALIHAKPDLVRKHLLLSASRQFVEGDAQHWWHPPSGRGVRTHCSDDYLWLPLAVCRYVKSTGDRAVLDEPVQFLDGRPVNAEDESYYDLPGHSSEVDSLYQHCVRAIRHGLRFGEHGLPLIGSGDWNDGMNLVGKHGKGESVWLGFFLCEVLGQFTQVAQDHGDAPFAELCVEEGARLNRNIEQNCWDGEWYRRAYFDDGTPLGSAGSEECQIDSISQSWSVLSGAGDVIRRRIAMQSVYDRLVRHDASLVQLLDPPFDKSKPDPGYIRGYVPGVRENGGQYTHAAIWTTMAFAELGEHERAWELLRMINPVNHALTAEDVEIYKVEPYVVSADIYAIAPHTGRGGWSWYTGSAGWMYRLILESLLGLRVEGDKLHLVPCIPEDWPEFKIHYRYRETIYHISVKQKQIVAEGEGAETWMTVDGLEQQNPTISLLDDRQDHHVELTLFRNKNES
ncbi:MAG: glucoamylase family protein [Formivibrio sp.]|nr:glucoamylase family protein [Formivibrio sp.]